MTRAETKNAVLKAFKKFGAERSGHLFGAFIDSLTDEQWKLLSRAAALAMNETSNHMQPFLDAGLSTDEILRTMLGEELSS